MGSLNVLQLVNQALQGLGLPQVNTIISAQDDQTGFQMLGLLNELGSQMVRAHDWQSLEKSAEFVGDGVTNQFPLPADYGRMVNQTQWSSKNKRPMAGPISPQGWSWVQYGIVSSGFTYRYRILDGKFTVFPTPGPGEKLNFFYISKNWSIAAPPLNTPQALVVTDGDFVVFDDFLMIAGIKFKLWSAKGLEATELGQEFQFMLATEKAQTQGAPVISLAGNNTSILLSQLNVPDGDWNV